MGSLRLGCGRGPWASREDAEPWTLSVIFKAPRHSVGGGVTDHRLGGGEPGSLQVGEGKVE